MTEKAVKFFVTMRCLMICKDENCTPALGPRGGYSSIRPGGGERRTGNDAIFLDILRLSGCLALNNSITQTRAIIGRGIPCRLRCALSESDRAWSTFGDGNAYSKDVFVHISAVEQAGLRSLNEGQSIEYEIERNRGRESAANLRVK
jgi:cold shock CspA family protein